jgi:hypothetical protein
MITAAPRVAGAMQRAQQRLFSHFAEPVLLGGLPVQAVIAENVSILDETGQVAYTATTASFHRSDAPQVDADVDARGQTWRIDKILDGDEIMITCILAPT